jgi:hypothetical protein
MQSARFESKETACLTSRVQKANGIVQASSRHAMFTFMSAAASSSVSTFFSMALYCSANGAVVGSTIECWIAPMRTMRGLRS